MVLQHHNHLLRRRNHGNRPEEEGVNDHPRRGFILWLPLATEHPGSEKTNFIREGIDEKGEMLVQVIVGPQVVRASSPRGDNGLAKCGL